MCVWNLVFIVPLHAARRAMAAAGPYTTMSRPRPNNSVLVGLPYLLIAIGRRTKERKKIDKGNDKGNGLTPRLSP